jgi:hypothetical protein
LHTGSDERERVCVTGGSYLAVAVAISHTSKLILKKMIHKSNSWPIQYIIFTNYCVKTKKQKMPGA